MKTGICRRIIKLLAVMALPFTSLGIVSADDGTPYSDARFGFALKYPLGWNVTPRDDAKGRYGSVLTFYTFDQSKGQTIIDDPHHTNEIRISVGLHTQGIKAGDDLLTWSEKQLRTATSFADAEIILDSKQLRTDVKQSSQSDEVVSIVGKSPMTPFRITNIRRGTAVWFIWTNKPVQGGSDEYDRFVNSFVVSRITPNDPAQVYNDSISARPKDGLVAKAVTDKSVGILSNSGSAKLAKPTNWVNGTPYYYAPIAAGTSKIVKCGSIYHTGTSQYAADLSMIVNTSIHSTHDAAVSFAGWDTTGYGNLMKTSGGSYIAWYAHLNSFAITTLGTPVVRGQYIANSGNTGTSGGPHLHFQIVFNYNDAVNLAPITNFAETPLYPGGSGVCGTMSR